MPIRDAIACLRDETGLSREECKIEHLPQVPCNGSNVDMRGGKGRGPPRPRRCHLARGILCQRGPPVRAWLASMSANSSSGVMPPSRRMETQCLLSIW